MRDMRKVWGKMPHYLTMLMTPTENSRIRMRKTSKFNISPFLRTDTPLIKFLWRTDRQFLRELAHRQTDRQTDRRTDIKRQVTHSPSLAEVIIIYCNGTGSKKYRDAESGYVNSLLTSRV